MSRRCLRCMEMFGEEFELCPHCGYIVGSRAEEAIHMEPGTILHDRYIIGKVLGFGGFGVTYIGWDGKLEQKVAIKEYLPGEFSTRMPGQSQVTVFNGAKSEQFRDGLLKFVEEAKRLAKFQNEPGIVRIFDSFEENETAYIIMEYLDGETLTEYLKKEGTIPEDQAVEMLMPVMESLKVVHAEGLLHRDIAPDNIFLTKSGEVKLIDFGASRYATTSHSRSLTVIIKPGYSPEEQYRSRGDQGPYTDVYALAATLYKMMTGKTPPDAMERRAKYETQNRDILIEPHKLNKDISVNRENAILNAMNVRIEDRTQDISDFIRELNSDPPAKRRYGKIKRINLYRWPLWLKILVPTLLAALICFGVLLLTGVINFSKYSKKVIIPNNIVIAPDVEGMYMDKAIGSIEDSELLPQIEGSVKSEFITAGKIVRQTPVGGAFLEKNGTVLLIISSGNEVEGPVDGIATVPYLIGDNKEDAEKKLEKAGLGKPKLEEIYDENISEGLVIDSSIKSGEKVEVGTVLTLRVSKGSKPFEMSDVKGKDGQEAKELLENQGLIVRITYSASNSVSENCVISQSVPAGSDVRHGEVVTLEISSGEKLVKVSNVVGKTQSEAVNELESKGFKVSVKENTDDKPAGTVIGQTPDANTEQIEGSTVTLFVSTGRKKVTVTYNGNGGSVSRGSDTRYINDAYGDLPSATRSGYNFSGWFTAAEGGTQVNTSAALYKNEDHTLYAHWSKIVENKKQFTVNFDAEGGSVSPSSLSVTEGSAYGSLPTPYRDGYSFNGWYTSSGNGVNENSTVSSNHTLYARWLPSSYTLTFNANGGTVSEQTRSVKFGSSYGTLPKPSRSYYKFLGWYTSSSGGNQISDSTQMGKGNVTVYAHWESNPTSNWVPDSDVPSGAKIVDEKWTYTLREYTESSLSSMSGWNMYDSKHTGWGSWSNWITSDPQNGSRNVESRQVYDHTEYHYYRWTNGYGCYTYQYNSGYWLEERWFGYQLPMTSTYTDFGYDGSDIPRDWWIKANSTYNHSTGRDFTRDVNRTEWRYQDPVYTYYFYRDVNKEASGNPSGNQNVSNVRRYVKYIAK